MTPRGWRNGPAEPGRGWMHGAWGVSCRGSLVDGHWVLVEGPLDAWGCSGRDRGRRRKVGRCGCWKPPCPGSRRGRGLEKCPGGTRPPRAHSHTHTHTRVHSAHTHAQQHVVLRSRHPSCSIAATGRLLGTLSWAGSGLLGLCPLQATLGAERGLVGGGWGAGPSWWLGSGRAGGLECAGSPSERKT